MLRTARKFGEALVAGLLVTAMVVTPALASTAATPAESINEAAGPMAGWMQLEPGATQWYKFKYTYDNSKDSNEPTQAVVELIPQTLGAVNFEVWTPERLNAPLPSDSMPEDAAVRTPVGVGSPMFVKDSYHWEGPAPQHKHYKPVVDGMHMMWAGAAAATDTYYIVVKNNTDTVQSYQIRITGPDVSF